MSWVLAGSPRVRSMVGHVVVGKPPLVVVVGGQADPSHHLLLLPLLHCHTQVMVAAVNGDVIIHPLLKLDISAAQICVSLRLSELDSSAFVSLVSACSKPAFN